MRKIGATAVALLGVGVLAGCGALPVEMAPSRTATPTAVGPAPEEVLARESAYIAALREQLTTFDTSPATLWLDLGHAVCEAFDSGYTPKQVFDSMSGGGLTQPEASAVVVIAGIHLCPEYAPDPDAAETPTG